jgi:hypothetical protein
MNKIELIDNFKKICKMRNNIKIDITVTGKN